MPPSKLQRAFRKAIRPLRHAFFPSPTPVKESPLKGATTVLLAHPDDEVFCSGLILELCAREIPVHLLLFTRGEGGERPDGTSDTELGKLREAEMRDAAEELSVSSLHFLNYIDPPMRDGILTAPLHRESELDTQIREHLTRTSSQHLITHGSSGEYWHPAHLALHHAARRISKNEQSLQLYTFSAWRKDHPLTAIVNQDDPADFTLRAAPFVEKRLTSLAKHTSQRAVFERFGGGSLEDFISKTSLESYRRW